MIILHANRIPYRSAVTIPESNCAKKLTPRVWHPGVGTRLLLAFFGITCFAVLAAAAAIYAFREVGSRLDVVDTRIPPTLSTLELSRSAERIIAAAPALLAAADRAQRDEVKADLAREIGRLNDRLSELERRGTRSESLDTIEPIVSSLTANLAALEDVVARRLETRERISALRRSVFQTNEATHRLLAPWLQVTGSRINALVEPADAASDSLGQMRPRLAALIELQRLMRTTQARVSSVADMLTEASTTDEPGRLPVLTFQLGLALQELEAAAAGLDPKLRPLFLDQLAKLRAFTEGPKSLAAARKQELTLVREGESLLTEAGRLSAQLTGAVDHLGIAAKQDIGEAIRDALSVQRFSTRALVIVVALSLLTSLLIVWLYVGRSIVRRLAALSDGMLAIAGGKIDRPVAVRGSDEIAAMARAVEVFRRNTLERNELLAEKARTADILEKEVEQRTAELEQSVEELRALGEVSRAVSSTVDFETVLTTIVAKATQLSNTDAGAIYVSDHSGRRFELRATYGMDEAVISEIENRQPGLGEPAVGEVVEHGAPIQIPDVRADPAFPVPDVIVRAGYRALLFVPLLGVEQVVGTLVVRRKRPGEFSGSTIELLQTFAAQSVLAIRNAQLFQEIQDKSRQLEVANRYKSHFLASASHDLRQPLHALNLFVGQLSADSNPEEHDRLLGRISTTVNAINELFETLLDMSKLEAGVLEPNITEFPVHRLLARIETTFADAAREKGLRLAVVPSSARVRSDFVLLERIVFNLVSNAVRYTARGGVVVGGRRRGDRLRVDVFDTGPGIPAEQQQKVFGEHYQVAGSDRRGGLGHGLAIVDRLGRLLAHELELSSRPGRGTRFSISVSLADEQSGSVEAPAAPASVDPACDTLVVVIDDDPLVLDGMSRLLGSWGCRVLTADSEETAQSRIAAQKQRPDLIIVDYRLADGRTGIEAVTGLREWLGAAVPAFLISGDTAPERLRDAREQGFHLLHKPVPPMRLRAVFNRVLKDGEAV